MKINQEKEKIIYLKNNKDNLSAEEIKLFNNDSLPYNADHYKTISFL